MIIHLARLMSFAIIIINIFAIKDDCSFSTALATNNCPIHKNLTDELQMKAVQFNISNHK